MPKLRPSLLALSALALASASAHANLLTNGSFEANDASASPFFIRYSPAPAGPTGWTTTGDGVDLIHNTYTQAPAVLVEAQDGVQFLDMNALGLFGGIQQTVSVVPGATYALSFHASRWANNSAGALRYAFTDATTGIEFDSGLFDITATTGWQHVTDTVVAPSSSLRLNITATGGVFQAGPGLDNVSLTAVPEPASAAILGGAAFALLSRRRLRNR